MRNNVAGSVCVMCAFALALLTPGNASAKELDPRDWRFAGDNARQLANVFDRRIETVWTSAALQKDGVGFTIDFGQSVTIHRLIVDPGEGKNLFHIPRSLRCALGEAPDALRTFHEADYSISPLKVLNLRFNGVKGRYLRMEIGKEGAGFPWSIAEMKIYGFTGAENLSAKDAVILPEKMPAGGTYNVPGDLGARDLSYYLGEITGRPVPVIKPDQKENYSGLLFVIEEPQEATFEKGDIIHRKRQSVHVYRNGREVRFAGHTRMGVFYSIVEFLDRQGVRWLFPSVYGDTVLRRGDLDLSLLPLRYNPQMQLRWLGGHDSFNDARYWLPYHRWNHFFGGRGTAYRGMGHHSFHSLIPGKLYEEHPDWFPMLTDEKWKADLEKKGHKLGQRIPYSASPSGRLAFCTSNREAREYIVRETLKKAERKPGYHSVMVGQMDACRWCECPQCRKRNEKAVLEDCTGPPPSRSMSESMFDFVAYLGRRLQEESPDRTIQVASMAYAQSMHPPVTIDKLPDNVSVDVVLGPRFMIGLPPGSPRNREIVRRLKAWAGKTDHLGVYNWDLLIGYHPRPFVTSASEWFKFWKELGVEGIEPEVRTYPEAKWRCNPWYYYAYSRLAWNPDEPAEKILREFFEGYFRDAAKPMLAYYKVLEDHVRAKDLIYGAWYGGGPTKEIFTPAILKAMSKSLREAEQRGDDFITRRRLAGIRKGFNLVLKALDVSAEDLNGD